VSCNLKPWIRRWWDVANDRRQRLILKQYRVGGLSKEQENELKLLQGVADDIVRYTAPRPAEPIVKDYKPVE